MAEPPGFGGGVGYRVGRRGVVGMEEVWMVQCVCVGRGGVRGAGDVELHAVAVAVGVELVVCCFWRREGWRLVDGGPVKGDFG